MDMDVQRGVVGLGMLRLFSRMREEEEGVEKEWRRSGEGYEKLIVIKGLPMMTEAGDNC